jgi:hypothetical protein
MPCQAHCGREFNDQTEALNGILDVNASVYLPARTVHDEEMAYGGLHQKAVENDTTIEAVNEPFAQPEVSHGKAPRLLPLTAILP